MRKSRAAGFVAIAVIYAAAGIIGVLTFILLPDLHIFLRVLIGDATATVFVYLGGVALKNVSVYDPYWSVAPIVILTGIAWYTERADAGMILLLIAVWYWGVRLTCNWAYTFTNLEKQDWRYDHFKQRFPRIFQLISFFGINMFPTLVVYLCLLPGIEFLKNSTLNAITIVGFIICMAAATLQLIADVQMHRFRRGSTEKDRLIREGLWKNSRHPNYLGEILMWWGVYIIMLSAAPQMWFLLAGPAVNTLMFFFVSIPLADRHNRATRPGFDEYYNETRSLLPVKRMKKQGGP